MILHHRFLLSLLALAILSGPVGPSSAAKVDIPGPEFAPSGEPQDPGVSYIPLSLRIPLSQIFGDLGNDLQMEIAPQGDREPYRDGVDVDYSIRRGEFAFAMDHDQLTVSNTLSMWLTAYGDFGTATCGEPEAITGEFSCRHRIGWSDNWRLDSWPTQIPTRWSTRCKPAPAGINFNTLLNGKSEQFIIQPSIQRSVEMVRKFDGARQDIAEAWTLIQSPMDLHDSQLWLSFDPQGIVALPVKGDGETLHLEVAIVAQPRILTGERPEPTLAPLPGTKVRVFGSALNVALDQEVPFEWIRAALIRDLVGQRFSGGDQFLEVIDLRLGGGGDEVHVAVDVQGQMDATLHLVGKLKYDEETLTLYTSDLAFTRATRTAMFDFTNGAIRQDLEKLTSGIAKHLAFDLTPIHQSTFRRLGLGLNSPLNERLALSGGAVRFAALDTHVSESAFCVRLVALGKVAVSVK